MNLSKTCFCDLFLYELFFRYFTDPAVIERIPKVFPVLGVVYAIILVVGSLMMCHPPKQEQVTVKILYHSISRLMDSTRWII